VALRRGAKQGAKGRRRRVLAILLLLMAGGLLTAFLARDLLLLHAARWALARTFDAQVSIGTAHFDSLRAFTLTEVTIRSEGAVALRASLPRVGCQVAGPADWLRGRLQAARTQGAEATIDLRRLDTEPLPGWLTGGSRRVGLVSLGKCTLHVIGRAGSAELAFDPLLLTGSHIEATLKAVEVGGRTGTRWSGQTAVTIRGAYDAERSALQLTVTDLPLGALASTLRAALGSEVDLEGSATVDLVAGNSPAGLELQGSVAFRQVAGAWAGEAVEWEGVAGSLDFRWQRAAGSDTVEATLHADRGGVLFRDTYLALGDFPGAVTLSCQWERKAQELQLDDLSVALRGLVEVELTGEVIRGERPRAHFEGELYLPALAQVGALVRSAFEGRSTVLSALRLGGWVEAGSQLDLTPGRTDLAGRLGWQAGVLGLGPVELRGISLALPVRVIRAGGRFVSPSEEQRPAYGLFVTRGLRLGPVGASLAPVSLRLVGDELQFSGDEQRLGLLDGEVVLSGLRCRRLWSGSPEMTGAVTVSDLSLARLTENASLQLSGTVSAHFPGVLAVGDAFRTKGTATVKLFGGTITVTELTGEDLTRPWWRVTFSALADRLDLRQMTGTLGWGRASGLLSGSAQGMVISAGEPERFEIELHNERVFGVPQTLTVEVLDRLPVISAVAPMLRSAGVETLQYDALGLWCRLENDRLWVRGTAKEQVPERAVLPIPLLGPWLSALGKAFEPPEPEGEFFILGRSGLRPLNVVLAPVPEEGLAWPAIWRGLRAAVGRRPDIEVR